MGENSTAGFCGSMSEAASVREMGEMGSLGVGGALGMEVSWSTMVDVWRLRQRWR